MSTEAEKTITIWVKMWNDKTVDVFSTASVAIRTIAKSGEGELFYLLPEPIQAETREIISQFLSDGIVEFVIAGGSSTPTDLSPQIRRFMEVLQAHGIDPVRGPADSAR